MTQPNPKLISLLTDFQTQDWYVAVMKAVMVGIEPAVRWIDISHHIPPQDVRAASFVLQQAYREFPPGTIFLTVVDPGVGTQRKPVIVEADKYTFVGPDNGVFGFLENFHPKACRVHEIQAFWQDGPLRSHTFHGRDLFAPAAAYRASGTSLETFGPRLSSLEKLDEKLGDSGKIVYIDHFGNAISDIPGSALPPELKHVEVGGREIPFAKTYGEVEPDQTVALVGSTGFLEIAINQGHAARNLQISIGDPVLPAEKTS